MSKSDKAFELQEKIGNILETIRTNRKTALFIAKDSAVKIADNLNREDEAGIKQRNIDFIDYRTWQAEAAVYEKVEKIITYELNRY